VVGGGCSNLHATAIAVFMFAVFHATAIAVFMFAVFLTDTDAVPPRMSDASPAVSVDAVSVL
jgi:hypothetical protein